MGRDNFPVTPASSGRKIPSGQLIVEDTPRIEGCSCYLLIVVLIVTVGVLVVRMMDQVELNLELLTVDNPKVQEYAIKNLAREGDPRAVDTLEIRLHDPNPDVRNAAAWALGEIGSRKGVDSLLAAVDTEEDYDLSCSAVSALLSIATRCPDGALRGEGCDDDDIAVRVNFFLVLWAEDDPLIAHIVSESLSDDDVDVRILAAQILVHIATEDVRSMLEAVAIDDGDERVRETAGRALAELGPPPSPEPEHAFPDDIIYPLLEEEYLPEILQDME